MEPLWPCCLCSEPLTSLSSFAQALLITMTALMKCTILSRIPGRLNDRRTPLGELNWIFTAITDTIAWNVLPRGEAAWPLPGWGERRPTDVGEELGRGRGSDEAEG